MNNADIPTMHTDRNGNDGVEERPSICIVPARVELPEQIAQRAREIAHTSDDPEKRVGDYLDEACMLDITYYFDGDQLDIRPDN